VIINGVNLTGATAVRFGSTDASSFVVVSDNSIHAVAPAGTAGTTVDVTVTTPQGTSLSGAADRYTFVAAPTVTKVKPTSGPVGGGTAVTVTGTNFLEDKTRVLFGSVYAVGVNVKSPTSLVAIAPGEPAGTVDVRAVTAGGTSAIVSADRFKFTPTITALVPNSGSTAGGNTVTIKGTGFGLGSTATVFKFGTAKATGVNCPTTEECTVKAPAHAAGKVDVKATVNKVTSPKTPADAYTYS
jgi:hypothetical protein